MASKFEGLLVDLSRQVSAAERLLQSSAQREQEIVRELGLLREKVARLEEGAEWSGEERRKVDQRLGTGDHTFERLKYEVKSAETSALLAIDKASSAEKIAAAVLAKVEEIRKSIEKVASRASSRRWAVLKMILAPAIAFVFGILGSIVISRYGKAGTP